MLKFIKQLFIEILNFLINSFEEYKLIMKTNNEEIERKIQRSNIRRLISLSLLFCLFSFFNLIISVFKSLPNTNTFIYLSNIIFIVVVIIYIFVSGNLISKKNSTLKAYKLCNITYIFFLYFIFIISLILEPRSIEVFIKFLFICMIFSSFIILKARYIIFLVTTSFIISVFSLNEYLTLEILLFIIFTCLLTVYISQILSFNFKRNLINEKRLEKQNKDLNLRLETDYLTKTLNRYGLYNRINFLIPFAARSKISVAVLMLDIDNFKIYNDTFGHSQGDVCLKLIAKEIKKNVKRETDFVCRFGGEEFVVFLYNVELKDAVEVAENIRKSVENLKIKMGVNKIDFVTISIGLAYKCLKNKKEFEELLEEADKLLYKSKKSGKNMVSYHNDVNKL